MPSPPVPCLGSGSYAPEDVRVLLRPMSMAMTEIEEKERLIQSGQKHYSEMISLEQAPSAMHQRLYSQALAQNSHRLAIDVQALAQALAKAWAGPEIVLLSFVRAGLPLGVLLRRALLGLGCRVVHYGLSIIRDRGLDPVALAMVLQKHSAEDIVFVDGWTGKGAIAGELQRTLGADPRFPEQPRLVVLADPCGRAWLAASAEDWLIPSGILGATVSGLISRSIWPADGGLHGCVLYEHLRPHDVSQAFINRIEAKRQSLSPVRPAIPWTDEQAQKLQQTAAEAVAGLVERFQITNINRIKPGIAEATRAVMRRVPDHVLVRDRQDSEVRLLLHLAEQMGVTVEDVGSKLDPYRAATIIRKINK